MFDDLSRHLWIDQPIYGLRYGISEPIDRQDFTPTTDRNGFLLFQIIWH